MSIAILGYPVASPSEIIASYHMVTHCLVDGFQAIPEVEITAVVDVQRDPRAESVPRCDFVVAHTLFGAPWPFTYDVRMVKSRCRKAVLVLELPSPVFDHCFVFQPVGLENETALPVPCPRSLLSVVPKAERAVLIDHPWPENEPLGLDRTKWIYQALEPLKDEFRFTQLCHFEQRPSPPPWVSILPHRPLVEYLQATERFGTFLVTHAESWGHALADMAARQIRIVAPVGFVRPAMVERLCPIQFDTEAELAAALRAPFDHAALGRASKACFDYGDICRIIADKLRTWL